MCKEDLSHEFRLKNIDETRNYFVEEISQNEFISKKHKKICTTLNYIEHLLILASVVTFHFYFASLIGAPVGFKNPAVGIKICAIIIRIWKNKLEKEEEQW